MLIPECPLPDTLSLGTTLEADLRGPLQGTVPLGPTKPPESCPLPDTIPIGTSQGYSLLHALSLMPSPAQPLLHTLLQETTQSQLSPLDPQQILWRAILFWTLFLWRHHKDVLSYGSTLDPTKINPPLDLRAKRADCEPRSSQPNA